MNVPTIGSPGREPWAVLLAHGYAAHARDAREDGMGLRAQEDGR